MKPRYSARPRRWRIGDCGRGRCGGKNAGQAGVARFAAGAKEVGKGEAAVAAGEALRTRAGQ